MSCVPRAAMPRRRSLQRAGQAVSGLLWAGSLLLLGARGVPAAEAAVNPEEAFAAAHQASVAGDLGRSIELYEGLAASGHGTATVWFNLGNARLRAGQVGAAIAAYRHSQELAPRDPDVKANLEIARRRAQDAITPPEPSPLAAILLFWHYALAAREMWWALVVSNLLFWASLAARRLRPDSELLRWLAAGLLLLCLAAAGSLAARRWWPSRVAVVLVPEVEARTTPEAAAPSRFKLHAGGEVRVVGEQAGWLRIALPSDEGGWVPRQATEVVAD